MALAASCAPISGMARTYAPFPNFSFHLQTKACGFSHKKLKEKFLKLCENSCKTHREFTQNSVSFLQAISKSRRATADNFLLMKQISPPRSK